MPLFRRPLALLLSQLMSKERAEKYYMILHGVQSTISETVLVVHKGLHSNVHV